MLRVAVCDDTAKDLRDTYNIVERWAAAEGDNEVAAIKFESPASLLESHKKEHFDLLVLDVIMPEQTGIELARLLRKDGDETMVIYTSSTTEYAMDAFGIQALGYVKKPVDSGELISLLERALVLYRAKPKKWLTLMEKNRPVKTELMDILYVENRNRDVIYVLRSGGQIEVSRRSGTFEEVIEPIPSETAFVQIHKSFFVNMKYIRTIREESLLMDDGAELPIARRRKAELKDRYMTYVFEEGGI